MTLERYRSVMPDWAAFSEAAVRPEPTVFRVRTGRIPTSELAQRLTAQGFRLRPLPGMPDFFQVEEEPYPVTFTLEHWMGLIYVQQASTGVAAPALAPAPGERVLDLCSAPGGKTCHAAELMEDRGSLVAVDVSEPRIRGLLGNVYRLGYTNVMVVAGDGRRLPEEALFDRVLVDAPCSGEGTLRKRGGEPPRQSRSFLGFVTSAQEALLRKAVRVTRPGGTILYVTCTFAPEENEAVVDAVLRDEPVVLEPLDLPVAHAPGLTAWEGRTYDPSLEGAARIYPQHLDSGGLFLARLRRLDGPPTGDPVTASDAAWRPVPPAFPDEGLEAAAVDELVARGSESLRSDFGIEQADLADTRWIVRGGRLWLHTAEGWPLDGWSDGPWRPISVGFRAVEFDSFDRPRPTNDLLQWLGPRVRAGRIDLDDARLRRLLDERALPAEPDHHGLVAFSWRDALIGRGIATERGVRSEVPKARGQDLVRVLDRMASAAGTPADES
ncbi:MAG: hypothetical protein RH859_02520 [Longimicrobiales bacterium]